MRGQKNDDVTRTDSAGVFADALGGETLLTLIGHGRYILKITGAFLYTRIRRSGSNAGTIFFLSPGKS